jgi:DNA mismatch repair protein MutS
MLQFARAKEQYPDALLFFRMGDFYELFHDDAVVAARALDLVLTSRQKTEGGEDIPMCGVPHHAATGYLARLLEKGFKVAICEQMADPKTVKGIVPREVVRVVTPGLSLDEDTLDARADNLLGVLVSSAGAAALASLELTRAALAVCVLRSPADLLGELVRLDLREVLVVGDRDVRVAVEKALPRARVVEASAVADPLGRVRELLGDAEAARADALGELARQAVAVALGAARDSQPRATIGIRTIASYDPTAFLGLDEAAVRNLEIVRTLSGDREGSLLALIDETCTSMGARMLRRRLLSPLADVAAIRRRHDAVESLVLDPPLRRSVRESLAKISDLERLATRAELDVATPRDLAALCSGLRAADELGALGTDGDAPATLRATDTVADLCEDLERALVDAPPHVATQGGLIRDGVDARIDELRKLATSSKDVLLALESRERAASGIAGLEVRFNRVFGYYFEITRTHLAKVPKHFRRKQTIATGERFTTDELDDLAEKILGAEDRVRSLEQAVFEELRRRAGANAGRVRALGGVIADLDVHAALAELAQKRGYVRPVVDDSLSIELDDSRHPIVEVLAPAGTIVPNDVRVDAEGERLLVITGPNMAGKSTVMRQTALAVILAQAGSFVPAAQARIGLVDRVFTRVGASDNLGRGQSTFMVEMRETATLCAGATRRSLVLLDEIGRGTSTFDGLAIAWAVAEHLDGVIACRALFATHYHELCALEAMREGRVANYNVAAREQPGKDGAPSDVVFLHRLVRGASKSSYGVAVARLAGLPEGVLARARQVLADLERGGVEARRMHDQLDLFGGGSVERTRSPIEEALAGIDLDRLTPLEALNLVAKLRDMAR